MICTPLPVLFVDQIKKTEMGGARSTSGGEERCGAYRVLVGKPEGERQLRRPRGRWDDNIKIDLQEVGGGMDWIDLAQNTDRWPFGGL
jgi:hypothetical protein